MVERAFRPLEADELKAVIDYAIVHGRSWKTDMSLDWYNASNPGILHALRNSHGPGWLVRFTLPAWVLPYRAWQKAANRGYGRSRRCDPVTMAKADARIRRLKERYETLLAQERQAK